MTPLRLRGGSRTLVHKPKGHRMRSHLAAFLLPVVILRAAQNDDTTHDGRDVRHACTGPTRG